MLAVQTTSPSNTEASRRMGLPSSGILNTDMAGLQDVYNESVLVMGAGPDGNRAPWPQKPDNAPPHNECSSTDRPSMVLGGYVNICCSLLMLDIHELKQETVKNDRDRCLQYSTS